MKHTKGKKILVGVVLCMALVCSTVSVFLFSGILSHSMSSDHDFTILQITDIHLLSNKKDDKAFETVDMMIASSNPDLIVVTGDISSNKDNERDFKKFAEFIEQYRIEWTFTFGNHDTEGYLKKPEISEFLQSLKYCSYQEGYVVAQYGEQAQASYGNYYKTLSDQNGTDYMTLFFMDSNMYLDCADDALDGYANFYPEQIAWYRKSVQDIALGANGDATKVLPSLAFFHIPMQEHLVAYSDGDKLNGHKFEDVFASKVGDDMFETMVALGSTKGVFVGHDHMNSYTSLYKGIKLSYGYSADHNIYLVPQKGGNIINIKQDGSFTIQGVYRNFGIGALHYTKEF